ncbi:MAG: hypothetical protein WA789_01000, partial [Candidatus Acidiferrum sp.]
PEKPVGRVYLHVAGPDGSLARILDLPGERAQIRVRATVSAHPKNRAMAFPQIKTEQGSNLTGQGSKSQQTRRGDKSQEKEKGGDFSPP